jgi:hypothetical protein
VIIIFPLLYSHINGADYFAFTVCVVWLLVRAGTGGTIPKAFGIMAKSNSYSTKHLARTHKPESKEQKLD